LLARKLLLGRKLWRKLRLSLKLWLSQRLLLARKLLRLVLRARLGGRVQISLTTGRLVAGHQRDGGRAASGPARRLRVALQLLALGHRLGGDLGARVGRVRVERVEVVAQRRVQLALLSLLQTALRQPLARLAKLACLPELSLATSGSLRLLLLR